MKNGRVRTSNLTRIRLASRTFMVATGAQQIKVYLHEMLCENEKRVRRRLIICIKLRAAIMKRDHVTFVGPALDDFKLLEKLPPELSGLLEQINGFILFHG